jgi:predicted signal transduction protein with EAL and GGDEF domain
VVFLVDDEAQAHAVATELLEAVNGPLLVDGREVVVSAAAGLAVAVAGESPDDVVRAADEAMYAAKARGRGRLEVASQELRALLERRLQVEATLDAALDEDRLEVHYQPVVQLRDGRTTGVEALVRLRQRDGRLVPPGEFIEVAERSGQVVALGAAVLDRACHEAASWTGACAALTVAVNLSTRQLGQPDVVEQVRSSLRTSGLHPSRLVLEVTESAVVEDAEATLTALTALKALGVRTAIDDFGTGYSSFLYLKQFPVDILKIDRSFVAGMLDSPDDAAIVASIVRLGLDVGLTLVAEGVETEEQRAQLLALGCTEAQGYLFCRPVPAAELVAGIEAASRDGARRPAAAPTGRRREVEVDPVVVLRMSDLSAQGASLHTIAAVLNSEGVLNPVGRRWHPRAVARCLEALVPGGSR